MQLHTCCICICSQNVCVQRCHNGGAGVWLMIFIQPASASYLLTSCMSYHVHTTMPSASCLQPDIQVIPPHAKCNPHGCSVLIGGCDDLVALHKSGALQLKLEKALIQHGSTGTPLPSPKSTAPAGISPSSAVDIDQDRPARSLFWFPDVVDNRSAGQ